MKSLKGRVDERGDLYRIRLMMASTETKLCGTELHPYLAMVSSSISFFRRGAAASQGDRADQAGRYERVLLIP